VIITKPKQTLNRLRLDFEGDAFPLMKKVDPCDPR